jgi:flagellar biogenesis protein FliO
MRMTSDRVQNGREHRAGFAAPLAAWVRSAVARALPRLAGARAERRMELIETLQLGGKRQLMLVSCDSQRFLVGAGGDSISSIMALPAATLPKATENCPESHAGEQIAPRGDVMLPVRCIQ